MIIEDKRLYITEAEIGLSLNENSKLSVEEVLVTANVRENLTTDAFEVEFLKIDAELTFEKEIEGYMDATKLVSDPIKQDMREKLIEHYIANKSPF